VAAAGDMCAADDLCAAIVNAFDEYATMMLMLGI